MKETGQQSSWANARERQVYIGYYLYEVIEDYIDRITKDGQVPFTPEQAEALGSDELKKAIDNNNIIPYIEGWVKKYSIPINVTELVRIADQDPHEIKKHFRP